MQKVELVGGDPWWTQNLGSLAIGLAAVFAAGLAAYISVRNHKQQLAHDRSVRDRDATRDIIDAAVREMSNFILNAVTFSAQVTSLEKARASEDQDPDADAEDGAPSQKIKRAEGVVSNALPALFAATNTMHAGTVLLGIRLGKQHPITKAHAATRDALKGWSSSLIKARAKNRDEPTREADDQKLEEIGRARSTFERACFSWMSEGP